MKKLLRCTTLFAFGLFLIPFFTYQTSRMRDPISIHLADLLLGKTFMVGGVPYNSGFNVSAFLAVLCALLAIACAWLLGKHKLPMRIGVLAGSAGALVFLARAVADFDPAAAFPAMLNEIVKGGVEFSVTLVYYAIFVVLSLNAAVCVTTERFAANIVGYKWWYFMLAPALIYLAVFSYLPMVGLSIMFVDFNPIDMFKSEFVGLKWFREMVSSFDGDFGTAFFNTVIISVESLAVNFPAPILLALLITECNHAFFKRTVQTVSYLPNFISWSIIGGLVVTIFSSEHSFLNGFRNLFDPEAPGYYLLNEATMIRGTLVLSALWKGVGWSSIIYIAGLTGVNPELYESAKLDGAGKLKQIWHISLPGISTLITLQLILSAPGLIGSNFDQVINLVYPLTVSKGKTLPVYIYEVGVRGKGGYGLSGNYSYSTVIGFCNSILSVALLLGANMIGKRINPDGAIW